LKVDNFMTTQIKTGVAVCGFRGPNLVCNFGYFKALPISFALAAFFGFQLSATAQGNLVDLYGWSDATTDIRPSQVNEFALATSHTSAEFNGGLTTNSGGGGPPWVEPSLTGDLNTTPGVTYEISYTLNSAGMTGFGVSMAFGDSTALYEFPGGTFGSIATNLCYTVTATSADTQMSLQCYLDPSEAIDLTGLSVQEVPEMSSTWLFCYGGCALLLARQLRELSQKRKRAISQ
jgi:hypothetical protein